MSTLSKPLALLHGGDSYILDLLVEDKLVTLLRIRCYPNNENVCATEYAFRDLTPDAKTAIIHQINRTYSGRMVKI